MHLLVRERVSIDEEEGAVDLDLAPADLVFLSFSDGDLAAIEAAGRRTGIGVAAASLARLAHPMSVDLLAERTVPGAGAVLVRLLGGLDRWRYGAEELAAACRRARVPLALVRGEGPDDPRLAALSTVDADALRRLEAMLREGGAENAARAVRLGASLGGRHPATADEPLILPACGTHDFGAACPEPTARAVLVFYRSHLHAADTAPLAALAHVLAARGIAVRGVFVDSLKSTCTASHVRALLHAASPDIILNATGFAARGPSGTSPLEGAECPVLQLTLAASDEAAWRSSPRGLAPADLAMMVILPELDGRLATPLLACKTATADGRRFAPVAGGVGAVADRAAGWIRLRRARPSERRLAIVLSDYPGAAGTSHARGYAVGLDTVASLGVILDLLVGAGYATERRDAAAIAAFLRDAAPGETLRLGHVLVALQPARDADVTDRRASYHDAAAPPSPAYLAFYEELRRAFDAHAILHLGTHGTLEWLPGKAAGLTAACLPTALTGGLPVIYPFIVSNPGEAAVAKRRLGAVTIGHLTPPLVAATLSGDAHAVERLLDEYAEADGLDRKRAALLRRTILERARDAGLLAEAGAADTDDADALTRLDSHLCDVKELRIADGLHVFATAPPARAALLDAVGAANAASLDACAPGEAAALLAALDGRFVPPGPAGAPSRGRLDVLPTGRNLAGIDPRQAPTPSAFTLARRNADLLLGRHAQEHGEPLATLVLDLWGSATLRTGGEDLALAFVLLGVEPAHDEAGRLAGVTVLSIAELGRPRVDVTLRISGVFRDNFAGQIALFDRAVRLVAARHEDAADNPLAASPGARVFGPAPGGYGVAAEAWVASSAWSYGAGGDAQPDGAQPDGARPGGAQPDGAQPDGAQPGGAQPDGARPDAPALAARVARAQAFLHHQDHAETDILDGPEHAAHEGGFARAAREAGRNPAIYHADITGAAPRIRLAHEEIARVVRGRLANPQWLAGQRRHGLRGASEMARGVEALAAFARLLPHRFDAQFDLVHAALLADRDNAAFLADANPAALAAIAHMLAAMRTEGRWHPRRNDL